MQIRLERTLPHAENVRALAAQHPANETAAVPNTSYDLFDRAPLRGQLENGGIGLFPTQVALVLDPLGSGE